MSTTLERGGGLVQLARITADAQPAGSATAGRRASALTWLETHGFPTRREEDWRHFPLDLILSTTLRPPVPDGPPSSPKAQVPDLGGPRLVFVNGCLLPEACRLTSRSDGGTPAGLTVASNERNRATEDDGSIADFRHAFEALNAVLAIDEITFRVAPGVMIDEPVHLVYLSAPDGDLPVVASPRIRLVAGRGSRIHVVETFGGAVDAAGLTNSVTTVHCEEGARVQLDRLQDEAENMWHLSLLDVHLCRDSRFQACSMALGASVGRHEVRVRLAGEGAEVDLDGLYLTMGGQRHDHPILVEHLAKNTRSRQRYQGVADGSGRGVFNGRIVVHPGALGADAEQSNRNLLLSELAEIDTRPRLEIFADDVRCTHGATVGRLDDAALYYLRSRGIPRQAACALLVHAAVDQTVDRLVSSTLRADVTRRVMAAVNPPDDVP